MLLQRKFTVEVDGKKSIHCMACSGQAVWLAGQGSAKVHLYHATSYQHLLDISVAHVVAQKLQSMNCFPSFYHVGLVVLKLL